MTTDSPAAAPPTLLERAKTDLKAALHDLGHPVWASEQLIHHIEAFIEAKFAALKQEIP